MALNSNRKPNHVGLDSIKAEDLCPNTKTGYYKAIQTVMSDLNLPLATNSTDWVKTFAKQSQTAVQPITVSNRVVPDLCGMGAKDAVYILENMGFNVQVQGRGKVISQNMKPGTCIKKGSSVMINLQ